MRWGAADYFTSINENGVWGHTVGTRGRYYWHFLTFRDGQPDSWKPRCQAIFGSLRRRGREDSNPRLLVLETSHAESALRISKRKLAKQLRRSRTFGRTSLT
jgi:hypothetical protein